MLLFDKLGLKTTRRTKTGLSTEARALQQLVGQHPFVEKPLEYRELAQSQEHVPRRAASAGRI